MPWWAAVLVTLLGGGLLTSLVAVWRLRTERAKLTAEGAIGYETLDERRRARIAALEGEVESLEAANEQLDDENTRLKRIAPGLVELLLLEARRSDDVAELLLFPGELWVISSPITNGRVRGATASVLWASENWTDELGRPVEELLGTNWYELVHPQDRDRTVEAERKALLSKIRLANRYRRSDGLYIALEWRALAYLDNVTLARALVLDRGVE